MRLIFIEGVSGVGKSTLTQKICAKLNEMGYAADCYLEGNIANPIDLYNSAYFQPVNRVPLSEYTRVSMLLWESFTHEADARLDFLLFDGSLLHHPVNDMMRNYTASCDQITYHVNHLIDIVHPLHPMVVYLSNNHDERLQKVPVYRDEAPSSSEKTEFWQARKEMDMSVIRQLTIPCDCYDISQENWDYILDVIVKRILETDEERRTRIYPVILSEYNSAWPKWFAEEKEVIKQLVGEENIAGIHHYGSTSVPGLTAKPTIDILLEINETAVIEDLITALPPSEYICLSGSALTMPTPAPHVMFLKGYLPNGFAEKVYHIHVVYPGEHDELLFRDYLIAHPEAAAEYTELKCKLFRDYEYDRDRYTDEKADFVRSVTVKARNDRR